MPLTPTIPQLVDLAGSEHRTDSSAHNAARRREGAKINSSLMALKECVRALARGREANVRYRNDSLTRMLKNSLDPGPADGGDDSAKVRVVVIATVSPASKDTEHTVATLSNACVMDGSSGAADGGEMSAEARAASRASIFNRAGVGGRGSVS